MHTQRAANNIFFAFIVTKSMSQLKYIYIHIIVVFTDNTQEKIPTVLGCSVCIILKLTTELLIKNTFNTVEI